MLATKIYNEYNDTAQEGQAKMNILSLLQISYDLLGHSAVILTVQTISLIMQITIGAYLFRNVSRHHHYSNIMLLLLILNASIAIENLSWIVQMLQDLQITTIDYKIFRTFISCAWMASLLRYQAFGMLMENVIARHFMYRSHQKLITFINIIILSYIGYLTVTQFHNIQKPLFSYPGMIYIPGFLLLIMIPSFIIMIVALRKHDIPRILKIQLQILLSYIILPHFFFDVIQFFPYLHELKATASANFVTISTIFILYGLYFCMRKIVRFRFLNLSNHVLAIPRIELQQSLKESIEQLSSAGSFNEINYITQNFFKDQFKIPFHHSYLHFRSMPHPCTDLKAGCKELHANIENFLADPAIDTIELCKRYKIFITDEIEFEDFYQLRPEASLLHNLLQKIHAEVFIPLFDKQTLIAYICILKNQEDHHLYDEKSQDRIFIFANYLARSISLLQNKEISHLVIENKKFKEELYAKHQEINQYKESLKHLFKNKPEQHVGILFYKNDHFITANEVAQHLVKINLNQQKAHPFTLQIKELAQQVDQYRTARKRYITDIYGQKLVVAAVPHLNQSSGVILTIYQPDTSDIIKHQIDRLHDPSSWDYTLYLETTKSGKLINQLIPGNGEMLLNFKIKILQAALTRKAIVLQSAEEDLVSLVEIIHTISLRENLHVLELQGPSHNHDLAIKIFGINPILQTNSLEESILKKLDDKGTFFIKNIEYLDHETQNKLAYFIKYGLYTFVKGEQTFTSDVRIICSVNQSLKILVDEGKIIPALYAELETTELSSPSLLTIDSQELTELIEGYTKQVVAAKDLTKFLQLTEKEKVSLLDRRPTSLHEFKSKVQQIVMQKSKENNMSYEMHFDPALEINDPELIKAAQLGKDCLKDAKIMAMLWNKFKNQNKIGMFLGVNRSSINRRCKEYNLI